MSVADLCRKHGVSDSSTYKWKTEFGGLEVSEPKRLKTLEDENTRLKRLLAELLLADGHRLVFRGFGLADSARDPAWDPRLPRLLALAQGAKVWVKLSAIGRFPDGWAKTAAARMLQELGPRQLLWGSEWPRVAAAHAYAPSYAQTLEWLAELVPDEGARGRSSARRLRPFTDFDELRPGHLPKGPNEASSTEPRVRP